MPLLSHFCCHPSTPVGMCHQWEGELKLLRASGVLMVLFHVTLCESEAHSQTCPYGSVICKICHAKKMWIKIGKHIYSAFSSVFLFKDFWRRVKQRLCLLFMSTEHDFTLLLLSHWWSFTEQTITAVLLRARHWSGQVGTHQWITQGKKKILYFQNVDSNATEYTLKL